MTDPLGVTTLRRRLNGDAWTLTYHLNPPTPLSIKLPEPADQGYRQISAVVPGCIETDLMAAGLLPDLYVGENVQSAWELERGDWWYSTTFDMDEDDLSEFSLIFHGLDTFADIFVNEQLIGQTSNMLMEHELPLDGALLRGENSLVIHLRSPLVEAERYEYTPLSSQVEGTFESLWVRKPAHMYGWDIAPRIVSAGIYRDVELVRRPTVRLTDVHLRNVSINLDLSTALVEFSYKLSSLPCDHQVALTLRAVEPMSGHVFVVDIPISFVAGSRVIEVEDAQFWWPRGYGGQPLYTVTVELSVDGEIVDTHQWLHGIRNVHVDAVYLPPPEGRFGITVNGQLIRVVGTNWVPLDALHSRDAARLTEALALLDTSGCNTVRCWGGNVYESDDFYTWCDQHGLMVWQDFALACARYPQDPAFLDMMRIEAKDVIRRVRRHPSLTLWSGSNENDDVFIDAGLDPNSDLITRQVLAEAVNTYDPGRPYIVGSPAYRGILAQLGRPAPPEQHLWGERAWFKDSFYTSSHATFVSEIGFHGSPARASLEEFIPGLQGTIDPHDPVWRTHETLQGPARLTRSINRTQLMLDQTHLLFGPQIGVDLDLFVPASQVAQAEALKFVVENSRLNKRRTGIIWWNLLDCWPQTSDSVVDYYLRAKLAFHYLRRAQRPVSIIVNEADGWQHDVFLIVDGIDEAAVTYRITGIRSGTVVLEGTSEVNSVENTRLLGRVPRPIGEEECYLIEWEVGGEKYRSHYLCGAPPYDLATYLSVFLPAISAGPDGWVSTF